MLVELMGPAEEDDRQGAHPPSAAPHLGQRHQRVYQGLRQT